MENTSGIYKITNVINNKIYIGQTKKLKSRKWYHFYLLKKNTHVNKYLQNSFNKNGIDNFKFELIEYTIVDKLSERELYYIQLLKPEYNLILSQDGNYKMSKQSKEKMSISKMKQHNSKAIYAKNLLTNEISFYECSNICAKLLNINRRSILKILRNERKETHNYTFSYTNIFPVVNEQKKTKRCVYVFDINFNQIHEFISKYQCSKQLNITYSNLHKYLKTNKLFNNKYYFSYQKTKLQGFSP